MLTGLHRLRVERFGVCRGIFQQLQDTLMLPEACKRAAKQSSLGYLFGGGERHILPSFFNLLIHLQKQVTCMIATPMRGLPCPFLSTSSCAK